MGMSQSKRIPAILMVLTAAVLVLPVSAGAKKKWYNVELLEPPLAMYEPSLFNRLKFDLQMPFSSDGDAGAIPSVEFQYQLLSWLAAGANVGYAFGAGDGHFPANFDLNLKAGYCSHSSSRYGGDWNGCIIGTLDVGMGFFELDTDDARSVGQGLLCDLRSRRFSPETTVIEPVLILAARGAGFGLSGHFGMSLGVPVYDTDARDVESAITYGVTINTRMLIGLGIGFRGMKNLSGDESHHYALDIGLRMYIDKPYIYPWIRVSVPLQENDYEMPASMSLGVLWRYDQ